MKEELLAFHSKEDLNELQNVRKKRFLGKVTRKERGDLFWSMQLVGWVGCLFIVGWLIVVRRCGWQMFGLFFSFLWLVSLMTFTAEVAYMHYSRTETRQEQSRGMNSMEKLEGWRRYSQKMYRACLHPYLFPIEPMPATRCHWCINIDNWGYAFSIEFKDEYQHQKTAAFCSSNDVKSIAIGLMDTHSLPSMTCPRCLPWHVLGSFGFFFTIKSLCFFAPLPFFLPPVGRDSTLPILSIETKRLFDPDSIGTFFSVQGVFVKRHQHGWSLYKKHNSNTCHPFVSTALPTSGDEYVLSDARNKKKESVRMCVGQTVREGEIERGHWACSIFLRSLLTSSIFPFPLSPCFFVRLL